MSISWETVTAEQHPRSSGDPLASISPNRISLNAESCKMIDGIYDCEWVDVKKGKENGKYGGAYTKIGLVFLKSKSKTSFHITSQKYKGQDTGVLNINSKNLVKSIFGVGTQNTKRYPVQKIDENTLAIDITKEL